MDVILRKREVQVCLAVSFLSSVCSISCPSVISSWFFLELSTLAVVPIMGVKGSGVRPEAVLGYFFAQVVGSSGLLVYVVSSDSSLGYFSFLAGICLKLGVGPFHWWVPQVSVGMGWQVFTVVLTLQKVAPIALLMAFVVPGDWVVLSVACLSGFLGSWGGLKEGKVMGIMGWSSISQGGWMVAACATADVGVALIFFIIYLFQVSFTMPLMGVGNSSDLGVGDLSINVGGQSAFERYCLCSFLLSMGGMPPTIGFFSKVLVLSELMKIGGVVVCLALVVSSVLSMFFYLRVVFAVASSAASVGFRRAQASFSRVVLVVASGVTSFGSVFIFM